MYQECKHEVDFYCSVNKPCCGRVGDIPWDESIFAARESAEEREAAVAQLKGLGRSLGALPSLAASEEKASTNVPAYKALLEQLVSCNAGNSFSGFECSSWRFI